jgi:hypothetical protein
MLKKSMAKDSPAGRHNIIFASRKSFMKSILFLAATLLSVGLKPLCAQQGSALALKEAPWTDGLVTLTDGKTFRGQLRYNEHIGLVSFRKDSDTISFTSNSLLSFSLHDTIPYREFVSLEFITEAQNGERTLFFQKVREYSDFAILFRLEPHIAYRGQEWDMPSTRHTRLYEVFTFYLLTTSGKIIPFIRQLSAYQIPVNTRRNFNFFFEKEHFENQIGKDKYRALKLFAKKEKLNFRKKNDVFAILKYYDQIRE